MTERPQLLAMAKGLARDLLALAGAAAIVYGAWLIYAPAGFIVGGIFGFGGAVALAYLESKSSSDGAE